MGSDGPLASIAPISYAVGLIFGGCCSNAWSLERLLKDATNIGSALTFCQIIWITLLSSRYCITFRPYPHLKPRAVPIREWFIQVFIIVSQSLLINWAFSFNVPLTLQIVFRSGGLAITMFLGWFFLNRKYTAAQIISMIVVTVGVIVATLSRPSSTPTPRAETSAEATLADNYRYFVGVAMLSTATVMTSVLGIVQERTFAKYGAGAWREGVFYTHLFALPAMVFLHEDIKTGLRALHASPAIILQPASKLFPTPIAMRPLYLVLFLNIFSQNLCVSGANMLTSKASAVTTNLVLTARKALSLCISVWYFGQGLNRGLAGGATLVLIGTVMYSYATSSAKRTAPTPVLEVVVSDGEVEKEANGQEIEIRANGKVNGHANGHINGTLSANGEGFPPDTAKSESFSVGPTEARRRMYGRQKRLAD